MKSNNALNNIVKYFSEIWIIEYLILSFILFSFNKSIFNKLSLKILIYLL
ncbi:hypothetical protein [Mycoplasma phocimorsus]|nr:hypothetical protein [Mycoplasma phocimorsus]MDJ1647626.1 hypothetical protein [Mycoplasma phocimorsus]